MTIDAAHAQGEKTAALEKGEDPLLKFVANGTPDAIISRYAGLVSLAQNSDFGDLDRDLVVLDTEATGFSINHDELTQIAAARVAGGKVVDQFVTFVNPGKPIPEDVAHLTDIHDEDVAGAPTPEQALDQLVSFIGDSKIVAHNTEFDRNFTTKHPAGYPLLENIWIDSLDLARIALPRLKSHRLIDLVSAFGAPASTHRADEDVAATCALFRILLAAVASMPISLVKAIAQMATPQEWPTVVVFSHFAQEGAGEDDGAAAGGAATGGEDGEAATGCVAVDGAATGGEDGDAAAGDAATGGTISGKASSSGGQPFSLQKLRQSRLDAGKRPLHAGQSRAGQSQSPRGYVSENEASDAPISLTFPTEEAIDEAFSPSGAVGKLYDDYEMRPEQLAMAQAVRKAFSTSDNLAVEAGTGVGKSMAYLIPAVLTARENRENNVTVGIATKTNALLDQLMGSELPALAQVFEQEGRPFTFAALKGFTHYPCLRKIEHLVAEGPAMRTVNNTERSQAPALAGLLSFVEQTEYGDIDDLKIDYRVLPRRLITTTSRECLRRKCPFYGTLCFVHGARQAAEDADVIVTNHSLLFCDLAAPVDLLPKMCFWVVDEAHGAEEEARKAFSMELSVDVLHNLMSRVSTGRSGRNLFTRAEEAFVKSASGEKETLLFSLTARAKKAGRAFAKAGDSFCPNIRNLLAFDPNQTKRGYEYVDLWISDKVRESEEFRSLSGFAKALVQTGEELITAIQKLVVCLEDVDGAQVVQRELSCAAMDVKDVIQTLETVFGETSERYAYAAHICRKEDRGTDALEALLYDVGGVMDEELYAKVNSVVFSSATLTIDGAFDTFEKAMGLNTSERSHCTTLCLGSSYDFDEHMKVYVANDIPEPSDPQYLDVLQEFLARVHIVQEGSMLTLFTNRREMDRCFNDVQPALQDEGLRLVCQKWGLSTKGLRDDFLADEHLSLFALKSFWEGFDAPGATLKGVVIPKLPFSKPTDPLSCERAFRDDQSWQHYVLPAAVLETKQAAGRIIRKSDDRGILVLADRRLVTKGYGRVFLRSLQSENVCVGTMDEIVRDIERGSGLF